MQKSSLKKSDVTRVEAIDKLKSMFKFLFVDSPPHENFMSEFEINEFYSDDILKPLNHASNYIDNLIKSSREVVSLVSKIEESNENLLRLKIKFEILMSLVHLPLQ